MDENDSDSDSDDSETDSSDDSESDDDDSDGSDTDNDLIELQNENADVDEDQNQNHPVEPEEAAANNNANDEIAPPAVTTDEEPDATDAEPNETDAEPESDTDAEPETEAEENTETEQANIGAEDANNDQPRRSTRESKPTKLYEPSMSGQEYKTNNLVTQILNHAIYNKEYALMMVRVISEMRDRSLNEKHEMSFAETYSLSKGYKVLGKAGEDAAIGEVSQLHKRGVFDPVDVSTLTEEERSRVLDSLIFLTQKRDRSAKARTCVDGRPQRLWMDKDEAASPTVLLESVLLTSVIDAREEREVAVVDIPNAFVQTDMEGDKVIMKMRGKLAELLVKVAPEIYREYVTIEKGQKVLYLELRKALYGMLKSALLFYRKLRSDLESIGFVVNPYDPCVANMEQGGSQLTVVWHVDDLKISHVQKEVVDDMIHWLKTKYEDNEIGKVKESRGKTHDYLGMDLDFGTVGEVKVKMINYVKDMLESFPFAKQIQKAVTSPAADNLFRIDENASKIEKERAEMFHTMIAKGLFVCKRARPDIMPTIAFLSTRVREPDEDDWSKLIRMMRYLNGTRDLFLTLRADDMNVLKWYSDASFAVHNNMRSHTGGMLTMGKGGIMCVSRKQKLVSKSSMEAELIAADDLSNSIIWTNYFLEAQGYASKDTVLFQDNKSCMLLHNNGKASSSKRTRHLNIRYYFLSDRIANGELRVEFCPTDDMVAHYFTKPLQGEKFRKFRKLVMNLQD